MRNRFCFGLVAVVCLVMGVVSGGAWGMVKEKEGEAAATGAGVKYVIVVDVSEVPEMKEWGDKLQVILEEWYPKIVEMLPSEGYAAPKTVKVTIKKDMDGVAYTLGEKVVGASAWFKKNPDDMGAMVHELVHVVQAYKGGKNPGWLVEGIADYVRWYVYEPQEKRPKAPDPAKVKVTSGYRVTAGFLEYVTKTHDKDVVSKLNVLMRQGKYTAGAWKEITGKTLEELTAEYVASLKKPAA